VTTNLARRFSRRRNMNMEMIKMVEWCLRLRMYLLLRLWWWITPLPHQRRQTKIKEKLLLWGLVASRREPPRQVQVDHQASRIIGDMNEHTTRLRVRNNSHFGHAAFVATFEPKDIGHSLSDHNWVNSMHEELENF
jgi:hypothetical protein